MPPIRVIGRIDRAEEVCAALRAAGMDAHVTNAAPMSVYGGAPPADGGIDVAFATDGSDPQLWRLAKRRFPQRPMVVVADRRHERVLRGAIERRSGADAYVTWPATPDELKAAVQRAVASAGRVRTWGRADVADAMALFGGIAFWVGGDIQVTGPVVPVLGALVAGIGLLLGVPFSWSPRWRALGGVLLAGLGFSLTALTLLQWMHWID